MANFTLTLDLSSIYSSTAPTFEVIVDGVVVASVSVTDTFTPTVLNINYSGDYPNYLSFRFNDSDIEGGRSIAINDIQINGNSVAGSSLSKSNLLQGQESQLDVTAEQSSFGIFPPGEAPNSVIDGTAGDDVPLNGTAEDDTINALAGNDLAKGGAGNDIIHGGDGNDYLKGGIGNDTLNGDDGDDLLKGEAGDDTINGGLGNDNIDGGDGDDTINGGDDNDILKGGAGIDTINGDAGNDILRGHSGTDFLYGGSGNDKLEGGDDNDSLYGGIGNDRLFGDAGDDLIDGEDGNDRLYGGDGDDTMYGRDGFDLMKGGDGNDTMFGGLGNDRILGDGGQDLIRGEDGNDVLRGGDDNDTLYGDAGSDTLIGDDGDDTLYGGDDNDLLEGGFSNDTLYGEDGNDNIYAQEGDDLAYGGLGNDKLNGKTGDDVMYGEEGNDTLIGGADNDTLHGGDGDDIMYGSGDNIATVDSILADNPALSYNAATGNFYQVVLTTSNYTAANTGATTTLVNGVGGHLATITSAGENAFIEGLVGNNFVWIDGSDAAVEGIYEWTSGAEAGTQFWPDTGSSYENWYAGSPTTNTDARDNVIFLGSNYNGEWYAWTSSYGAAGYVIEWEGSDILSEGQTADEVNILNGGDGNDTIYGAGDADILNGDAGTDTIYSGSYTTFDSTAIQNVLDNNAGVVYNADTDSFYQFVNTSSTYNVANTAAISATLTGLSGVNGHLATITSQAENDIITGLTGSNFAWIDGTDAAVEGTFRWTGGVEAGTEFWPTGYENFWNGSPTSNNGTNDNILFLGSGYSGEWYVYTGTYSAAGYVVEWDASSLSDTSSLPRTTINGGLGDDNLYGATGLDTFIFDNTSSVDTIYDFDATAGVDQLDVSGILSFNAGTDDIADFVRLTEGGGNTTVAVDVDGLANGVNFVDIAVLDSVTGLNVATLLSDENLIA